MLLGGSAVLLGVAGVVGHPVGLAGVAVFYGVYRLVWVSAEARLQERITGDARATVTSVAGLGGEVFAFARVRGVGVRWRESRWRSLVLVCARRAARSRGRPALPAGTGRRGRFTTVNGG